MNYEIIIRTMESNRQVFYHLFAGLTHEECLWKPAQEKWCLLEVLCHLYDEERGDFRTRLKSVLDNPQKPFPPIDPIKWVTEHKYLEQNYNAMLPKWLEERKHSIDWLRSLQSPSWDNTYQHPTLGPMSGNFILANWLEHDYLHIRQITRLKHQYLEATSGEKLTYAGQW